MLLCAAKGVFRQDFPPLLLLPAVQPVPRSQSHSSAVGQLRGEIWWGDAALPGLLAPVPLQNHLPRTGRCSPRRHCLFFLPRFVLRGWSGPGFGVAVMVGFAVQGSWGLPSVCSIKRAAAAQPDL